ncbi:MAG: hypothetical protein PGN09_13785 [Sphingomonas fennica]
MRRWVQGVMAAAALAAVPVQAQAACWGAEDAASARVRDLQSMLMVAALRCQAAGFDISGDYNGFVNDNRGAIVAANDALKRRFIRLEGAVAGQAAYDRFTTRLANAYGAGRSTAADCATAGVIARDARMMANDRAGLLLVADHAGLVTDVEGGACQPVTIAAATPAAPVLLAAAGLSGPRE